MPNANSQAPQNSYDSRWFIWTIVFLVAVGISLVSYIALSDNGTNDIYNPVVTHAAVHKTVK